MKYLLLVLTLTLSSNCVAQNYSELIKKAESFKGKEDYFALFLVLDEAWKAAKTDKDKQIEVLFFTASSYHRLENFTKVDSLNKIAIPMCESQQSKKQNPFYVRFICFSALVQAKFKNYEKALILAEKAIQYSELDSYDYAWSTGTKGSVLQDDNKSAEAAEFLKRSYDFIQKNYLIDSDLFYFEILYADVLQDIGGVKLSKQIIDKLIPEIIEKTSSSSIYLDNCYNLLGLYYNGIGDVEKSVYYAKKGISINSKKNNFESYLISLYNISHVYLMNGVDLDSAVVYANLFEENVKMTKDSTLQQLYAAKIYQLNSLIYGEVGDYDNGIKNNQQALKFIEKNNLQKSHAYLYIKFLNNLALNYVAIKDYEKAIFYFQKCLEQQVYSDYKPLEVTLYGNLATCYYYNKQYNESLIFEEKALVLSEELYGKESSRYIYFLQNRGLSLLQLKRSNEAIPHIQNALIATQKNLGKYNERTIIYTANLLCAYRILQQKDSINILTESLNSCLSSIYTKNLPKLNERNRNNFIEKYKKNTQFIFSTTLDSPSSPDLTTIAYDHALLTKGIVQAYTQAWKQQLEKTTDKKLKTLYGSWLENKLLISKQYEIEIVARVPNLDSIVALTENMESQLSQKSASFRLANEQVKWQQVQSKLKDGEASVEFIHFQYRNGYEATDSIMYAALVLKKGDIAPTLVPLFEEKTLDKVLSATKVYNHHPTDLYRLVWQPLEKYLGDATKIYYAPSGKLELVAFDALCYQSDLFLRDKYKTFRRLRSTRTLYFGLDNTPLKITKNTRNLLLGDVKFGIVDTVEMGKVATMGIADCGFSQVENGARQYQKIDSLTRFYKLKNLNQRQYEASEAYFKRIITDNSDSPEIIQFFTHGFYQAKPTFSERCALLAIKDPLYRSGVALANANVAWCEGKNTKEKEDNLLMAAEISTMDLSNTKVVILTACQSGLGDLQGGEGIQGLQSAFKMANAKTQLVALWNIDPFCAEMFSSLFYDKILGGASPYEAFHATQTEVIVKKYGVNLWGAFMLVE